VGAARPTVTGLHPAWRSTRTLTERRSESFGADGDHLDGLLVGGPASLVGMRPRFGLACATTQRSRFRDPDVSARTSPETRARDRPDPRLDIAARLTVVAASGSGCDQRRCRLALDRGSCEPRAMAQPSRSAAIGQAAPHGRGATRAHGSSPRHLGRVHGSREYSPPQCRNRPRPRRHITRSACNGDLVVGR
jgi:hypothetical protein